MFVVSGHCVQELDDRSLNVSKHCSSAAGRLQLSLWLRSNGLVDLPDIAFGIGKVCRAKPPGLVGWGSEQLEKQEKQTLSLIRKAQHVEIAYGLAQQFVTLLKERNAHPLSTWLWDCQMSGISDLVTFVASDWRKKGLLYTRHSPFPTVMGLSREKSTS